MLNGKLKVINALFAIADGAEVPDKDHGVCFNSCLMANTKVLEDNLLPVNTVVSLYGTQFPLEKEFGEQFDTDKNKWEGERGEFRRNLAGFVAAELQWRLGHE